MIVTLCTERIRTLDHIRAFLEGSEAADITPHDREAAWRTPRPIHGCGSAPGSPSLAHSPAWIARRRKGGVAAGRLAQGRVEARRERLRP